MKSVPKKTPRVEEFQRNNKIEAVPKKNQIKNEAVLRKHQK